MSRTWTLAVGAVVGFVSPTLAGELDQPSFAPGDVWVYDSVTSGKGAPHEVQAELSVTRLQGDRMQVATKEIGSDKPPVERLTPLDWSRLRSVNGVETLVSKPLSFPLSVGKTWSVDYTEMNPNLAHTREQFTVNYKVVGWETIKAAAGEMKALKIEGNGTWIADTGPRVENRAIVTKAPQGGSMTRADRDLVPAKRATGRLYKLFYYVPAMKRWVKSVEEIYSASGVLTGCYAEDLKDFHAAGG